MFQNELNDINSYVQKANYEGSKAMSLEKLQLTPFLTFQKIKDESLMSIDLEDLSKNVEFYM